MKTTGHLILVLAISLLFIQPIKSQKFGLGVSAIVNPQTESFGFGFRAEIPANRLSIVPQIAYYPGFGKITEFYGGLSLHFDMFNLGKNWTVYAIGHGAYNHWMNPKDGNQPSNWDAEAGLGLKTTKCLRPFIEYRYNFKWYETNLRIGLMYFFGCRNKKSKAVRCPAYN